MKFSRASRAPQPVEHWVRQGDEARGRRDWAAAARCYKAAVEREPTLTDIWLQYGHALKESGERLLAEQAYRMAIARRGGDADAHLQLGHLLKLENRSAEAGGEYCTALLLDPDNDAACRELAAFGHSLATGDLRQRCAAIERDLETANDVRRALEQRLDAVQGDLLEAQEFVREQQRQWAAATAAERRAAQVAATARGEAEALQHRLAAAEARVAELVDGNAAALAELARAQADLIRQQARNDEIEERLAASEQATQAASAAAVERQAAEADARIEQAETAPSVSRLIEFDLAALENRPLRDYALVGYSEIDGWGINDYLIRLFLALDAYQQQKAITGNLFELGVFHGRVLVLLGLMSRADERVVGLDIFEDQSHNIDASGGYTSKEIVERNLRRYGLHHKTDLVVGDSLFTDFTAHAALRDLRFAHIDGAHYVDAIVNDLMKTQQLMAPGGIIVVDDFLHVGFPGVNEGCHRFLSIETPRLVIPFAAGANKLFLTTHSHHADLLAYMRDVLVPPNGKPIKIHGFDAVSLEPP